MHVMVLGSSSDVNHMMIHVIRTDDVYVSCGCCAPQKKRLEKESKLSKDAAEKERVRLAIEEDKRERKLRAELTAAHPAGAALPDGAVRAAGAAPAAAPAAAGGSPVAGAAAARATHQSMDGEGPPLATSQE